jgi:surface antigen
MDRWHLTYLPGKICGKWVENSVPFTLAGDSNVTRLMIAVCAVGILAGGLFAVSSTAEEKEAEKITNKQVMQKCMKGGLCKKVGGGEASDEEKAELLKMFKALAANKPPKGEEASWKAKTKALVDGAQAAVDGKENAGALLMKAANCKACHDAHRPAA